MLRAMTSAALLACASCQQTTDITAKHDPAADSAAIDKLEQGQIAAISAKDPAKSSNLYAADAIFIDQNGQLVTGGEAISANFKAILNDPALKFDYRGGKKTFSTDGTMAYSVAPFTESYTDPATKKVTTIKGTNLSVWRKQADGSWKLVADSNPGVITG